MDEWVKELTKDSLNALLSKEFGVLLYYAKGCAHCESFKPKVEEVAALYPAIGFYKIELGEGVEEYNRRADSEPEYVYEPIEGSEETRKVPVLDENGQPVMSITYSVPCLYFYHTKAITEENSLGYIGGMDSPTAEELVMVCNDFMNIMGNGLKE
jgi:thiol-disulfide isomerase/thioredoxin